MTPEQMELLSDPQFRNEVHASGISRGMDLLIKRFNRLAFDPDAPKMKVFYLGQFKAKPMGVLIEEPGPKGRRLLVSHSAEGWTLDYVDLSEIEARVDGIDEVAPQTHLTDAVNVGWFCLCLTEGDG